MSLTIFEVWRIHPMVTWFLSAAWVKGCESKNIFKICSPLVGIYCWSSDMPHCSWMIELRALGHVSSWQWWVHSCSMLHELEYCTWQAFCGWSRWRYWTVFWLQWFLLFCLGFLSQFLIRNQFERAALTLQVCHDWIERLMVFYVKSHSFQYQK